MEGTQGTLNCSSVAPLNFHRHPLEQIGVSFLISCLNFEAPTKLCKKCCCFSAKYPSCLDGDWDGVMVSLILVYFSFFLCSASFATAPASLVADGVYELAYVSGQVASHTRI